MPIRSIKTSSGLAAVLQESVSETQGMYHRLVIVVETESIQKHSDLVSIANKCSWPVINVNLELSSRLKDMPINSRPLNVDQCLREIIGAQSSGIVLLLHNEILFDRALEQNPALMLRHLSRNRTVVAAWNGHVSGRNLVFGPPEHPDHQRFELDDEIVLNVNAIDDNARIPAERPS